MVGDRLDTDILFGQNGGCKTLLVLSGCHFLWSLVILTGLKSCKMISSLYSSSFYLLFFVGVTSLETLESPNNKIHPDFYTDKLSDLLSLKPATTWYISLIYIWNLKSTRYITRSPISNFSSSFISNYYCYWPH